MGRKKSFHIALDLRARLKRWGQTKEENVKNRKTASFINLHISGIRGLGAEVDAEPL